MPWLSCPAHPQPAASPLQGSGTPLGFTPALPHIPGASLSTSTPLPPLLRLGCGCYLHCLALRLFGCYQNSWAPKARPFPCLLGLSLKCLYLGKEFLRAGAVYS